MPKNGGSYGVKLPCPTEKERDLHWLLWHTNPEFYAMWTPTFMPYEPPLLPPLLGIGVVFTWLNHNTCSPICSKPKENQQFYSTSCGGHKGFHSRPTKTPLKIAKDSTAHPLRRPLRCPLWCPVWRPLRCPLPSHPKAPTFKEHLTGRRLWRGDGLTGVLAGVSVGSLVGVLAGAIVGLLWNPLRLWRGAGVSSRRWDFGCSVLCELKFLVLKGKNAQEDANGEKLTVKKWWLFGCRFFHGLRRVFTVYKGHKRWKKNLVIDMIFFTVSFSRFAPSRNAGSFLTYAEDTVLIQFSYTHTKKAITSLPCSNQVCSYTLTPS